MTDASTNSATTRGRILWWGRFGNYGPNYPRNRTVMKCLHELGWEVIEFHPKLSQTADIEILFRQVGQIDAVWVPCFRQRDLPAAARWAKRHRVKLIFDPLISAYDKQVFEKKKFLPTSYRARRLLRSEVVLFRLADTVIADTSCHKDYFIETLACDPQQVVVIPVSAEEELFFPAPVTEQTIPEFLFFGTFIGLQGPKVIAEAIALYQGPPIQLTFLGEGPERPLCEQIAQSTPNSLVQVRFEDWIPFHDLPARIRQAAVCLGIFGEGEKSRRVIPNKVYQALACGRPVITRLGDAYPKELVDNGVTATGMQFLPDTTPASLAKAIAKQASAAEDLSERAFATYRKYFSNDAIRAQLTKILSQGNSA